MANQYDYRETVKAPLSPRYSISRPMAFPAEGVINSLVPAEFGFYQNEHVMLCLYNPTNNTLIKSQRIDLADNILEVKSVQYQDGSYLNYISFDFTALNVLYPTFMIPGIFDLVINVFEDMMGYEDNKKLVIDKISDSRTELQLSVDGFFGEAERKELDNIVIKSIPRPFLGGITDNLLEDAELNGNPSVGITSDEVLARMSSQPNYIAITNLSLESNFKEILARILVAAHATSLAALEGSKYRLNREEYWDIIEQSLVSAFENYDQLFDQQVVVT